MTGRRCSDLALNLGQHLGPRGGPLDEVARVLLVQPVAVGDVDELVVAHAALVGEERELRAALLAALADDLRVVVNVGGEVLFGAVLHVDVDLHKRFVHRRLPHVLVDARLEPRLQRFLAVAILHVLDELLGGRHRTHREDERAHEVLGAVGVEKGARHLRRLHRVDLLHVELNVLRHVVRVEVVREVGRPGRSGLAHVDERPLVGQASLRKRRPRTSS
mmetsp:Transcript_34857/g.82253  ORF Transcript_34857/g.82253 Transcript_34857/m.82253 type:complete len:219 (+) Transcript_34857:1435-2091(+)